MGSESLVDDRHTLEEIRAMSLAERDALRICRRCWESYDVCVCDERKVRTEAEDRG